MKIHTRPWLALSGQPNQISQYEMPVGSTELHGAAAGSVLEADADAGVVLDADADAGVVLGAVLFEEDVAMSCSRLYRVSALIGSHSRHELPELPADDGRSRTKMCRRFVHLNSIPSLRPKSLMW